MEASTELAKRLLTQGMIDSDMGNGMMGALDVMMLAAAGMPYGPKNVEDAALLDEELYRGLRRRDWFNLGFALGVIIDTQKLGGMRIELGGQKALVSMALPGAAMTEAVTLSLESTGLTIQMH